MLRHSLIRIAPRRLITSMSQSLTPVEDLIRERIDSSLGSETLVFPRNDSHKHAHHVAMANSTSKETHFHLTIVSDAFKGMGQLKRHRMVYALFEDQMKREGGIHAMQLETRTHAEYEARKATGGDDSQ